VAEKRNRRPINSETFIRAEGTLPRINKRYASNHQCKEKTCTNGKMGNKNVIHIQITPRRVRIDPEERRNQYIRRLESLVSQLDEILVNPRIPRKQKLRAMDVLIKTIRTCYGIVRDIEVEQLEQELETLKTEGQGAETSYGIEEDPAL